MSGDGCFSLFFPYSCNDCMFLTDFLVELHKHNKLSTVVTLRKYKCKNCNFRTYSCLVYLKHKTICFNLKTKEEKNVIQDHSYCVRRKKSSYLLRCLNCKKYKTNCRGQMNLHFERNHSKIGPRLMKCGECRYKAWTEKELRAHLDLHLLKFKCDLCGYKTRTEEDLQEHGLLNHSNIIYGCDQCDYESKFEDCVELHRRKVHRPIKIPRWYKCDKCTYKANTPQIYMKHIRTHRT